MLHRRTDGPRQCVVCTPQVWSVLRQHLGCLCCIPSVRSRRLETRTCCLCSVGAYTDGHKRLSLEESFIMHSRLGLGCSRTPGLLLCELLPLKPPLSLALLSKCFPRCTVCARCFRGTPWSQHRVMSRSPSCSASSASVLVLLWRLWVDISPGPLSSTRGLMMSARIASPCFPRPRFWDSRRAFHRSPPNEFDCHAPSSRGFSDHPS